MRVGRIGYINCFPVYRGIDQGVIPFDHDLVTGTPSELNDLIAAGALGLSVVSAVEWARNHERYRLLDDLAISCDGEVHSVALFSRRPAEELTGATVLLSQSSRTSVELLRLLFRNVWLSEPGFARARTEAADLKSLLDLPHDAAMVIGDSALHLTASGEYPYVYDLGQMWKEWTSEPFVFAVWAALEEADEEMVLDAHSSLLASRDWGLQHLDQLADSASEQSNLSPETCRSYLGNLDYAFSTRHRAGLARFLELIGLGEAAKCQLDLEDSENPKMDGAQAPKKS